MVGWPGSTTEFSSGAAMNAIPHFPTPLATELQQLRSEVESHRQAIKTDAMVFEQSRAVWSAQGSEISRRMNVMRQRLAGLLLRSQRELTP